MTLYLSKLDKYNVRVSSSYGPTTYSVDEHMGSLRSFWAALGHLLDEMENHAVVVTHNDEVVAE